MRFALFAKQRAGEGEDDAFEGRGQRGWRSMAGGRDEDGSGDGGGLVPEPVSVAMAVLPAREGAIGFLLSFWGLF